MKHKWLLALLVAGMGLGALSTRALATPASGVTTPLLVHSLFNGLKLHGSLEDLWNAEIETHGKTDLYVVDNKFAPGATSGWHSHPGPSLILVLSGTVTNHTAADCDGDKYSAGQGFVDPGGSSVHMVSNDGTVTAETIAVQFIPTGDNRRTDAPEPARCFTPSTSISDDDRG